MLSALYMHLTPFAFLSHKLHCLSKMRQKNTENRNSVFYCGKSGDFCVVTLENMTNLAMYTRSTHCDQNYSG